MDVVDKMVNSSLVRSAKVKIDTYSKSLTSIMRERLQKDADLVEQELRLKSEENNDLTQRLERSVNDISNNGWTESASHEDTEAVSLEVTDGENRAETYKKAYQQLKSNEDRAYRYIENLQSNVKRLAEERELFINESRKIVQSYVVDQLSDLEKCKDFIDIESKKDRTEQIKLYQSIRLNPPPIFQGNDPMSLIKFLNEDVDTYFDEFGVMSKWDKCEQIHKVFKKEDHKMTSKRFLKLKPTVDFINKPDVTMLQIYKSLVNYIYIDLPLGELPIREPKKMGYTNYLEKCWTIKSYADTEDEKIGYEILSEFFKDDNFLNASAIVKYEMKKKFFLDYMNHKSFSRAELMSFMHQMDMLYKNEEQNSQISSVFTDSMAINVLLPIEEAKVQSDCHSDNIDTLTRWLDERMNKLSTDLVNDMFL